ncbi:MAG: hypothetical protein NTY87_06470 [Planctomycetia bacterium]|nr:hypothetical protein [Planctomycetia bacterium]RLT14645.1 MAG: hypothetical protein DWI25_04410 [Planctomycetota bacterium]
MRDTLGLLEESLQLARDLGYSIREEPLGDLPGGACLLGGVRQILINMEHAPAERLDLLLRLLAEDSSAAEFPVSRLLAKRLEAVRREL